jgi:hypothetical protein
MSELPPCGLYKTKRPLADKVPAGRLVFFHNHGDPGAGVYLPESGTSTGPGSQGRLPHPFAGVGQDLEPLPAEGFYRVREPFYCCDKRCRLFEAESFVQLGYDGERRRCSSCPSGPTRGWPSRHGHALDSARWPGSRRSRSAHDPAPESH